MIATKVGRNEPCPCGSGAKFKKCCGAEPAASAERESPPALHAAESLLREVLHAGMHGDRDTVTRLLSESHSIRSDPAIGAELGRLLQQHGKLDEALECLQLAHEEFPRSALIATALFEALSSAGRPVDAMPALEAALVESPGDVSLLCALGCVQGAMRQWRSAVLSLERAAAVRRHDPALLNNLGVALLEAGRADEAVRAFRAATALPDAPDSVRANLAGALVLFGQLDEALSVHVERLVAQPRNAVAYSELLFAMNYSDRLPAEQVATAHRRYAEQIERPLERPGSVPRTDAVPTRRLRIGFVSSDLRVHSVAFFVEPLLQHLDGTGFELVAYSSSVGVDEVTARLRALFGQWRDVVHLPDDDLARLVQDDEIDILIDLNGHSDGNRLPVFARKPAPIQVTWLGYPNTSGLQGMDFRIVDAITDPPGVTDALCSEKLWRLPECFVCYRPAADSPSVSAGPFARTGRITFGTMNNLNKMSPLVASLWARIIDGVPESTLLLKTRGLPDPGLEDAVLRRLQQHGLPRERVRLLNRADSVTGHLARYAEIDVALDTFPYCGTTTTCDALWMGVPVVTLAGDTHVSRVGASLLCAVGLSDLVATDAVQYVERALALATDHPRRAALRGSLRSRMAASPLTDGPGFTRRFEAALREMWGRWWETGC